MRACPLPLDTRMTNLGFLHSFELGLSQRLTKLDVKTAQFVVVVGISREVKTWPNGDAL